MKTFQLMMVAIVVQVLLGVCGAAQAQTAIGSLGVTITLRTFSEAVTADHRCTQAGQTASNANTLRISCPATVDVQAIARISAAKTGQSQRMNVDASPARDSQLLVAAGKPMSSTDPIELTISW